MPMTQANSRPSRHRRSLYNSSKLRENCCVNCKKSFKGKDEHLKLAHLWSSGPQNDEQNVQLSVVESISILFDGYLKFQGISLNRAMSMHLCIPCASTISSLYRIYKKFMDATSPQSVLKDIIKDSPLWENSHNAENLDSQEAEVIIPDNKYDTEEDNDEDWPGDDDNDDSEEEADITDFKDIKEATSPMPIRTPVDSKSSVVAVTKVASTLRRAQKSSHVSRPALSRSSARPPNVKPPNVRLDKNLTYRQMLEMKKSGTTTYCNYIPDPTLAPGDDPPEIRDLKRGSRTCPYCNWNFRSMTELHNHLLNIAKIENFMCPYPNCNQKFAWDCFYAKHLASIHSEHFNIRGCEKCPQEFNTQYELLEHESKHEEEDLWVSDLDNPPKALKKQQKVKYNGEQFLPCLHCGKLFSERRYLKRHTDNCHDSPPLFRCERCPWVFPKQDLLAEHSVCHTGELAFTCEHCGDKFNNRKSMENHIFHFHRKRQANFEEEDSKKKKKKTRKKADAIGSQTLKKHKCDECDKAFAKRSNLIQHVRMDHQGLQPLECKICSQRFASDEARITHEETFEHKEYSCPDCSKIFYKQARLDAHTDSHIPVLREKVKDATHICETCGKLFKLPMTLARHLKTHDTVVID